MYNIAANATNYTDNTVANGTRYYYWVSAQYGGVESEPSFYVAGYPVDPNSSTKDTANLFVSQDGSDTEGTGIGYGNGSIAFPYKTINVARNNLSTLGHIFIKDGVYVVAANGLAQSKSATLQSMTGNYRTSAAVLSASGSATVVGNTFTLTYSQPDVSIFGLEFVNGSLGRPQDRARLVNNFVHDVPLPTNNYVLSTSGGSYMDVVLWGNDFKDIGARTANHRALVFDSPFISNWTVAHNTFDNVMSRGITVANSGSINIRNNVFKNGCSGITIDKYLNNNAVDVGFNTFTNNTGYNSDTWCQGDGIRIAGAAYYFPLSSLRIHHNTFAQNTKGLQIMETFPTYTQLCDMNRVAMSLSQNSFATNNDIALRYECTNGTLDANSNYWGDASGPVFVDNPGGIGAFIADTFGTLKVSPFLTSAP